MWVLRDLRYFTGRVPLADLPTCGQTSGNDFGDCCMTGIFPGDVVLNRVAILLLFVSMTCEVSTFGGGSTGVGQEVVALGQTSKESILTACLKQSH